MVQCTLVYIIQVSGTVLEGSFPPKDVPSDGGEGYFDGSVEQYLAIALVQNLPLMFNWVKINF